MTTLGHGLRTAPTLGLPSAPARRRARGLLAAAAGNAYVRFSAALLLVAVGLTVLAFGIGIVLNVTVPLVFADELRALKALLPQIG